MSSPAGTKEGRDLDQERARSNHPHVGLVFAVIFVAIFLLHSPLLQLPYFWDEAGYYIPAARDILLTGSLVPHTTVSNAHPPLLLAWLALWWKIVAFAPVVTRSAMVLAASFSLLGVYRLAERVANTQVAIAATLCTAVYPVFFAQSTLAQVDLAAGGFVFWGLSAYLEGRAVAAAVLFCAGALTKETAVLAPLGLAAWELLTLAGGERLRPLRLSKQQRSISPARRITALIFPTLPLATWYAYHYTRTGYIFGNPEFFRYNVAATLNLTRFFLALGLRLWQVVGYLHLWALTSAMLVTMWLMPPYRDERGERWRIAIPVQAVFVVVISVYVVAMAMIGGAVLARYMLPVVPLIIILSVSTLWRRLRWWAAAIGVVAAWFVIAWFWNPPYGFSPEDNLAYRDYVLLHEDGERYLEARYPMARVLTAWPASDEVTRPWLGYITRPLRVVRIENFSVDDVVSAADFRANFDVALVFSTKYEPGPAPWDHWSRWTELKSRFFGFHRDLPAAAAARILGGHVVFDEQRKGQWIAVIEVEKDEMQNAGVRGQGTGAGG